MNTHSAIVTMQTLARSAEGGHRPAAERLVATAEFLGLDLTAAVWVENAPDIEKATVADLIAARAEARKAKNFAEADRIRAELEAMGITLKDARDPKTGEFTTTWEVKR